MKTTITVSAFVLGIMFVAPFISEAATYEYVNTQGNLQTVNADNAASALALAPSIAPNSGVMLVSYIMNTNGTYTFEYVTVGGSVQFVTANSVEQALSIVATLSPNSGVMLVNR